MESRRHLDEEKLIIETQVYNAYLECITSERWHLDFLLQN